MATNPEGNEVTGMSADPAVAHIDRLGNRLMRLEETVDQLIETHRTLMNAIEAKNRSAKRKLMPSPNTKYFDFLVYLEETFKGSEFTSDEIPQKSRHILSILNTEYRALDVVSKRGRTNVYKIAPEARKELQVKGSD